MSGPASLFYSARWVGTMSGRNILGFYSYTGTAGNVLTLHRSAVNYKKIYPTKLILNVF